MPNKSYIRDIPTGSHQPAQDYANMATNTNSADDIWNVDHYGFNLNNGGYHLKSTYVAQGSDAASVAGQIVEYSKTAAGNSELYLVRDGGTPFQFTKGSPVAPNTVVSGVFTFISYQTFLPGGLLMKGGTITRSSGGSSSSVLFTTLGLTAFTTINSLVSSTYTTAANTTSGGYGAYNASATGFSFVFQGTTTTLSWTAIGV